MDFFCEDANLWARKWSQCHIYLLIQEILNNPNFLMA